MDKKSSESGSSASKVDEASEMVKEKKPSQTVEQQLQSIAHLPPRFQAQKLKRALTGGGSSAGELESS